MDISVITKRVCENGPYEWVNPQEITGINRLEVKSFNAKLYYMSYAEELSIENEILNSPDFFIKSYLENCITLHSFHPGRSLPTSDEFFNAILFLVIDFGCVGAAYGLGSAINSDKFINNENAANIFDLIWHSILEQKEIFILITLCDFLCDVFHYGELWTNVQFSESLASERMKFLDFTYEFRAKLRVDASSGLRVINHIENNN